jgi:hypothetical protein
MTTPTDLDVLPGQMRLDAWPPDGRTLAYYEQIIAEGLRTFIAVGQALLAIRDQQLYRPSYPTFEFYVHERWQMSRPRAYQLMDAAQVVDAVSTTVDILPTNEAQARPLTRLPPEQQRKVWREAVETASASGITARHVQAVVRQHTAQTAVTPTPDATPPPRTTVQEALWSWLRVMDDDDAWGPLAVLWLELEHVFRMCPNITPENLAYRLEWLDRLLPLFPPDIVAEYELDAEWVTPRAPDPNQGNLF